MNHAGVIVTEIAAQSFKLWVGSSVRTVQQLPLLLAAAAPTAAV
jgi:hypothetical protein